MMTISSRRSRFRGLALCCVLFAGCGSSPAAPLVTATTVAANPASPSLTPSAVATARASATPDDSLLLAGLVGRIAFVDEKSAPDHAQIYVADETRVRQLVASKFDDRTPVISPDGKRLLFTRYTADGAPPDDGGVFVVDVDGTYLHKVDAQGEDASWSPDGSKLVFTRDLFDPGATTPYSVSLWIENLDGSDAHQITRKGLRCDNVCAGGWQDNQARWSPDGKRLVFLRDLYTKPEHYEIVTSSVDGSDIKVVTPAKMDVGNPSWSPDGSLILFQSPPEPGNTEQNLYTIKPDGTGLTQLTSHLSKDGDGVEGAFHPSWSPDGTSIVFSHYPGISAGATLYMIQADGSAMRQLTGDRFNANAADWGVLPKP